MLEGSGFFLRPTFWDSAHHFLDSQGLDPVPSPSVVQPGLLGLAKGKEPLEQRLNQKWPAQTSGHGAEKLGKLQASSGLQQTTGGVLGP